MKKLIISGLTLCLIILSVPTLAKSENSVVVIPLSTTPLPVATTDTIVSASGQWTFGGQTGIPSLIIKDLIFYVESDSNPPCEFSMNYVIDQIQSRTIRRFSLLAGQSVQISFGAGVNSADLRFGTIGLGTCVRNWAVFGLQLP